MSDAQAKAKEVLAGCPEVWNRACHIDQVTFEALEKRITAAIDAREIRWTSQKPTQEGWWWWRDLRTDAFPRYVSETMINWGVPGDLQGEWSSQPLEPPTGEEGK